MTDRPPSADGKESCAQNAEGSDLAVDHIEVGRLFADVVMLVAAHSEPIDDTMTIDDAIGSNIGDLVDVDRWPEPLGEDRIDQILRCRRLSLLSWRESPEVDLATQE